MSEIEQATAQPKTQETAPAQVPAVVQRVERIVVQNDVPVLDTGLFEQMHRVAKIMASSSLVPAHLNCERKVDGRIIPIDPAEAVANCFLVVNQSVRWRMDPFAVAQGVFVTKGRVGYEGKLIAAVINTHPALAERLSYAYSGDVGKPNRMVTVSGRVRGDTESKTIQGTVEQWKTDNDNWRKSPDQMLSYRGAREWARRWMPEAIMGVYADEEVQQIAAEEERKPEPRQERSATARLGAALGVSTQKPESASDRSDDNAEVVDAELDPPAETGEPAKQAESEKKYDPGKKPGTPKIRKQYVEKMGACTDADTLDVIYDETRAFIWGKDDSDALSEAYKERKGVLAAG